MKKRVYCLLLACILLLLCGCEGISINIEFPGSKKDSPARETQAQQETVPVQSASATVEGPGFSSPEEAILAYARALQQGNVDLILSTFAIETFVENYDLEAYLEVSRSYAISHIQPLPTTDDFTADLNKVIWEYQLVRNLTYLYLALGDYENNAQPVSFNGNPYSTPGQLVDAMTVENCMAMLADMKIGKVLRFEDLFEVNDSYRRTLETQKTYLGCDDLVPLAVEITLNGQTYYLTTDAACYDGKWYNCKVMGTIGMYLGADILSGGLYAVEE